MKNIYPLAATRAQSAESASKFEEALRKALRSGKTADFELAALAAARFGSGPSALRCGVDNWTTLALASGGIKRLEQFLRAFPSEAQRLPTLAEMVLPCHQFDKLPQKDFDAYALAMGASLESALAAWQGSGNSCLARCVPFLHALLLKTPKDQAAKILADDFLRRSQDKDFLWIAALSRVCVAPPPAACATMRLAADYFDLVCPSTASRHSAFLQQHAGAFAAICSKRPELLPLLSKHFGAPALLAIPALSGPVPSRAAPESENPQSAWRLLSSGESFCFLSHALRSGADSKPRLRAFAEAYGSVCFGVRVPYAKWLAKTKKGRSQTLFKIFSEPGWDRCASYDGYGEPEGYGISGKIARCGHTHDDEVAKAFEKHHNSSGSGELRFGLAAFALANACDPEALAELSALGFSAAEGLAELASAEPLLADPRIRRALANPAYARVAEAEAIKSACKSPAAAASKPRL